jgi:hypothetical protein
MRAFRQWEFVPLRLRLQILSVLFAWVVYLLVPTDLIPEVIYPKPYTLHPTPYTLHPTPYTLHPTPYTLDPIPYTLNPKP